MMHSPPLPSFSVPSTNAAPRYPIAAILADVPVKVLVDTGLPAFFVSKGFAERARIRYWSDIGNSLQCANGSKLRTYRHMKVTHERFKNIHVLLSSQVQTSSLQILI